MSYTNVYPSRINWENEPNINTPINATNLNKMDYALYSMDGTLDSWDVTKANQSDLLLCVKSIDYDDETGEFLFTWQNGTTKTVDLNIEKSRVISEISFSLAILLASFIASSPLFFGISFTFIENGIPFS